MYRLDSVWVDRWVSPLVSVGEACKAVVRPIFFGNVFVIRSSYTRTMCTASLCARSLTENRVSDFITVIQDFGVFAS